MNRPKKDIMILSEKGVITSEALLAYARNELTAAEKQELEKLLLADPFAQEALEGLHTAKANTTTTILNVNRKVRERAGIKEKKTFDIHWTNYAWAAVVVGMLIGIGFVLINFIGKHGTQQIAMKNESAKEEKPAPVIPQPQAVSVDSTKSVAKDTMTALVAQVSSGTTGAKGAAASGATGGTGKNQVPQKAPNNPVAANKPAASAGTGAVSTTTNSQARLSNGLAIDKNAVANNANNMPTAQFSQSAGTSADNGAVNLDEATKNFNSGDYKKAGEEYDQILKHEPDNLDALYFGAISDYIDNKTAKSETQLDKVIKKGGKYTDGAKWYKANILLKRGDLEHSKTLLQELSNSNNPYRERAIKKIAEMGF
jgi:tetratricopeptide (TPR) repeat protein